MILSPREPLAMSEDIFGGYNHKRGARDVSGIHWVEARGGAKHSTIYRTSLPQERIFWSQMPVVLGVRNTDVSWLVLLWTSRTNQGEQHWDAEDPGGGDKHSEWPD